MAKREASICARQREIGRERKETGGRQRCARVCNRRPAVSERSGEESGQHRAADKGRKEGARDREEEEEEGGRSKHKTQDRIRRRRRHRRHNRRRATCHSLSLPPSLCRSKDAETQRHREESIDTGLRARVGCSSTDATGSLIHALTHTIIHSCHTFTPPSFDSVLSLSFSLFPRLRRARRLLPLSYLTGAEKRKERERKSRVAHE